MSGNINSKRILTVLTVTTLLSPLAWNSLPSQAAASPTNNSNKESGYANDGFPTRRFGGGTRNAYCPNIDSEKIPEKEQKECFWDFLIALMPNKLVETVNAQPTIHAYIPAIDNRDNVKLELVLRDGDNDEFLYETTFKTDGKAAIVPIQIPGNSELTLGKNYHWYLSIIYNEYDRANDDHVEGWIRRIPMSQQLSQRLANASFEEKVNIYSEQGLWHEAFAAAAQLKRSNADDNHIIHTWQRLLQSVKLDQVKVLAGKLF